MLTLTSNRLAVAAVTMTSALAGFSGVADAATHHHHKKHAKRHATSSTSSSSSSSSSSTAGDYPGSGSGSGSDHRSRETELTGDTLAKAKAAAEAAVPGGTVWRASTEDPDENTGAAYEVHVTKADGSEVEVLLDSDFNVVKIQDSPQRAGGGGGHGGCPGHDDGSDDSGSGDYPSNTSST
jgi:uncharacterized membrane protein YkoI